MLMAQSDFPIERFSGPSRRFGARFQPVCREARLAANLGEVSDQFALLLDISLTGASVATDRFPRYDRPIWLRLDSRSPDRWSEAKVVGVMSSRRGPHVVRLEFQEPCCSEVLEDVVQG